MEALELRRHGGDGAGKWDELMPVGFGCLGSPPFLAERIVMVTPSANWEAVILANPRAMGMFFIVTAYILRQNSGESTQNCRITTKMVLT
jgi:hypothetical protein